MLLSCPSVLFLWSYKNTNNAMIQAMKYFTQDYRTSSRMILNLKENSVFLNTGSNLKKSITFRLEVIAKI